MITRKELIESKEFWLVKLQAALYEQVENYLKDNKLTKTEFAKKLGVSKGYISQILNGDFDHKLSKFIELSLAIGKAPMFKFEDLSTCHAFDSLGALEAVENNIHKYVYELEYKNSVRLDLKKDRRMYHVRTATELETQPMLTTTFLNNFEKKPPLALA